MQTRNVVLLAVWFGASAATYAEENESVLPEITVRDRIDEEIDAIETRRTAPAARIVYGREDIERFQGNTVGELLRKLPGVTFTGPPGSPKDVRLRGLDKGYTQILIDGEPVASGSKDRQLQVDLLPADMVERIEIIRNPTAEYDANGIGGTINIVLRDTPSKRTASVRAAANYFLDTTLPQFSVQYGDSVGDFSYLLGASVVNRLEGKTKLRDTQEFDTAGTRTKWEREHEVERVDVDELAFTPRLKWRLSGTDTFTLRPFLIKGEERRDKRFDRERYTVPATGDNLVPNGFILETEDKAREKYRLRGEWSRRLAPGEFTLRFSAQQGEEIKDKTRLEHNAAGTLTKTVLEDESKREREHSAAAKWLKPFGDHAVSSGAEAKRKTRTDRKTVVENGAPKAGGLGDRFDIEELTGVLWVQDEWQFAADQVLSPGLRWERIETRTMDDVGAKREGTVRVLNPSLHYLWQITRATNLRASVARTLKAPKFEDLTSRVAMASGTNSSTNPDKTGNPELQPESAVGVELGIERFFAKKAGVLGVNAFYRDVEDLIEKQTTFDGGRWVERPVNVGEARIYGVETDVRARMDAIGLPQLTLSGNYARLYSRVQDSALGITTKMKDQPDYMYNVGFTYDVRPLGLSFGANYNYISAVEKRDSLTATNVESPQKLVDVFVAQRLSKALTLRFSVSNANDMVKTKDKTELHSVGGPVKKLDFEREQSEPSYFFALEGKW